MKLTVLTTTQGTLPTMKVTLSWLIVWRPSADLSAQWDAAQKDAENRFRVLEFQKVGRTIQNPLGSVDLWTVTEKVVIRFDICTQFCPVRKCVARGRGSEG